MRGERLSCVLRVCASPGARGRTHAVMCVAPNFGCAPLFMVQGYALYGASDRAFCESLLHIAIEWHRRPAHASALLASPGKASPAVPSAAPAPLFLQRGFAERKLLFVTDMIQAVRARHEEGQRRRALEHPRVKPYTRCGWRWRCKGSVTRRARARTHTRTNITHKCVHSRVQVPRPGVAHLPEPPRG